MHTITSPIVTTAQPQRARRRKGVGFWAGRVLLTVLALLVGLAALGASYEAILNDLHSELGALSSRSRHDLVAGATHGSLVHNRDHAQVTIAAINQVVEAARTGLPLAP